jgi:hypothetical protein
MLWYALEFHSFLRLNNILLYAYAAFCLTFQLLTRHLVCFHLLAIVNNAVKVHPSETLISILLFVIVVLSTVIKGVPPHPVFYSAFEYAPRSGIGGSHGNSILSFMKDCQILSQWLHISHFHSQCTRVSISYPC